MAHGPLTEADAAHDPIAQFARWFEEAQTVERPLPNAVALATAGPDGRPSLRMVLLKDFDERGFVFYSNYESRKARDLGRNPHASLLFYWGRLERQVRVEGRVAKVTRSESDAYFRTRPRGSQLAAWASPQSETLENRAALDRRLQAVASRYPADVPRPPYWGGYRLVPAAFEFWQGRADRLHDRLRYRRARGGRWVLERLAP